MAGVSRSIKKKIELARFLSALMQLRYPLLPFISSSLQTLALALLPSFHLRGYW